MHFNVGFVSNFMTEKTEKNSLKESKVGEGVEKEATGKTVQLS